MVPPFHGMVLTMTRGVETLPADDHSMIERNKPDSLSELDDRLRRLRKKEEGNRPAAKWDDDTRGALGIAVRVGVELVAAIGVGVGIGYLLDKWLDTMPWLLVAFFLLGAAAGMMNVYRVMSGMGQAVGYSAGKKGSADNIRGDDDNAPRET